MHSLVPRSAALLAAAFALRVSAADASPASHAAPAPARGTLVVPLAESGQFIAYAGENLGVVPDSACEILDAKGVRLCGCWVDKVFPHLTRLRAEKECHTMSTARLQQVRLQVAPAPTQ
jgi:hypothetical protein